MAGKTFYSSGDVIDFNRNSLAVIGVKHPGMDMIVLGLSVLILIEVQTFDHWELFRENDNAHDRVFVHVPTGGPSLFAGSI